MFKMLAWALLLTSIIIFLCVAFVGANIPRIMQREIEKNE